MYIMEALGKVNWARLRSWASVSSWISEALPESVRSASRHSHSPVSLRFGFLLSTLPTTNDKTPASISAAPLR